MVALTTEQLEDLCDALLDLTARCKSSPARFPPARWSPRRRASIWTAFSAKPRQTPISATSWPSHIKSWATYREIRARPVSGGARKRCEASSGRWSLQAVSNAMGTGGTNSLIRK